MTADTTDTLRLDRLDSPVGPLFLATDELGRLRVLEFGDYEERMKRLMRRQYAASLTVLDGRAPAEVRNALERYFDGDLQATNGIDTATGGTEFQRRVWAALRDIPVGATESYGALAARIGLPSAARAVGWANGSNPIAIVVPCHRVIGANGTLTGFGGGLPRKEWLLAHEGAAFRPLQAAVQTRLPGL